MKEGKILTSLLILATGLSFALTGCSKKDDTPADVPKTVPVVTTAAVTDITQTSATCGGNITSDGGSTIILHGIQWSLTPGFEKYTNLAVAGTWSGPFVTLVTGLSPNALYYIRAFAANGIGAGYGSTETLKTLKPVIDSVADVNGNIYHVVPIGTQSWLCENLRVTKYNNGDAIPNVTVDVTWKNLSTGAWCVYDNQAANGSVYGNLYNWHALADSRGLCPAGWHVPTDAEWNSLSTFLGGMTTAGGPLKSTGTLEAGSGLWYAPNTGATNSTGFTGLPGGTRINYGNYYSLGNVGYFWSSSDTATDNAFNFVLDANNEELVRVYNFKTNGFSVRCCKD